MTGSEDHIKDVSTHRISLVAARCEPPHIDIDIDIDHLICQDRLRTKTKDSSHLSDSDAGRRSCFDLNRFGWGGRDVVSAVLAALAAGPAVHGEVLHIAQAEAPTILEYYQAVATALNDQAAATATAVTTASGGGDEGQGAAAAGAAGAEGLYVVELDPEDEVSQGQIVCTCLVLSCIVLYCIILSCAGVLACACVTGCVSLTDACMVLCAAHPALRGRWVSVAEISIRAFSCRAKSCQRFTTSSSSH
jgi:hypothetical protein